MFMGASHEVDIGTVSGSNSENLTVILLPQTQFVRNCMNDSKLFPDRHKQHTKHHSKSIISDFARWVDGSGSLNEALQQDLVRFFLIIELFFDNNSKSTK